MTVSVHEGLFTIDPPALLGARCDGCGHHHFPRLAQCPYCGVEQVRPVTLSDRGTLWGWTEVTVAPPGYRGEVPFGFGVVELPEGLRVITRLAEPTAAYTFGLPMRLRIVELHTTEDGNPVVTWEFAP
ncbi:MAG: DNA-binding protein [Actinobacteria bacterium]|nr:DNA-binding protein [Actinomycetota bacterium]